MKIEQFAAAAAIAAVLCAAPAMAQTDSASGISTGSSVHTPSANNPTDNHQFTGGAGAYNDADPNNVPPPSQPKPHHHHHHTTSTMTNDGSTQPH